MTDVCAGCGKPITRTNADYCLLRLKLDKAYCYDCQMRLDLYRGTGLIPGAQGGHKPAGVIKTTDEECTAWVLKCIAECSTISKNNLQNVMNWRNIYAGGRTLADEHEATITAEVAAYIERYDAFKESHPWRRDL